MLMAGNKIAHPITWQSPSDISPQTEPAKVKTTLQYWQNSGQPRVPLQILIKAQNCKIRTNLFPVHSSTIGGHYYRPPKSKLPIPWCLTADTRFQSPDRADVNNNYILKGTLITFFICSGRQTTRRKHLNDPRKAASNISS